MFRSFFILWVRIIIFLAIIYLGEYLIIKLYFSQINFWFSLSTIYLILGVETLFILTILKAISINNVDRLGIYYLVFSVIKMFILLMLLWESIMNDQIDSVADTLQIFTPFYIILMYEMGEAIRLLNQKSNIR